MPTRSELFSAWRDVGRANGFSLQHVKRLLGNVIKREPCQNYAEALQAALARITATQSHFLERDLVRHVAEEAQGRGLDAAFIRQNVAYDLKCRSDIAAIGQVKGQNAYTTSEMIQIEKGLLQTADTLQKAKHHVVRDSTSKRVLADLPNLSDEQVQAVKHVTETPGAVKVVSGLAGTGKTTMLNACREIWEREGYVVLGGALSGKAARGLAEGSGIPSMTLAMMFMMMDRTLGDYVKHHAKQLVRAAFNLPTWNLDRLRLDSNTVVVIDEAGMVGTRHMARLIEKIEGARAKLVLVGDAKQLQAIDAGGPFQSLAKRLGQAELTDMVRQEEAWARQAAKDFGFGNADKALRAYAERGLLAIEKDRESAIAKLVSDWAKHGGRFNPQSHVIFTGTNVEAARINRRCQASRKNPDELARTTAIQIEGETFYEGDRLLFTKNSRRYRVQNGDLATIIRIDPFKRTIVAMLDNHTLVTIPVKEYNSVKLGYAITTHKGQGATVENAYVMVGGHIQNREISYVQASRARKVTRLYTSEHEAGENLTNLIKEMSKSNAKDLAHDVLHQQKPPGQDQMHNR